MGTSNNKERMCPYCPHEPLDPITVNGGQQGLQEKTPKSVLLFSLFS